MSIENITSKIIEDARTEAEAVLEQARSEARSILSEAEDKAAQIERKAEKEGREEKEKRIARRRSVADIDGRKLLLERKQQMIDECFHLAVEKLANLDQETYLDFLAGFVRQTGVRKGELIFSEREATTIGKALIEKLEKDLPGSEFTIAEEFRQSKGGFILKDGSVYINGTIEAFVAEAREDLTAHVAELLFR